MPEGHTVHRSARLLGELLHGEPVAASSPQGRFADSAERIDGQPLVAAEAYGKHLFLDFAQELTVHVHLGLYGKWTSGHTSPPLPKGALRLRLATSHGWADLRGPTACDLVTPPERAAIIARLGPDPLRSDADPERAWRRIVGSRAPVAGLLMDQSTLAGIGNVYRAEVLYRARLAPLRPGRDVGRPAWDAIWADLVTLLRSGVRAGRIITTRPADRERGSGRVRREDAHYVYRRTGLPCRVCGTPVRTQLLLTRNLFWCPSCQGDLSVPTGV